MIHDTFLRLVVTTLFVLSAAECVYEIAAGPPTRTLVAGRVLHFVMSVAMVVMVWPRGAALPTTGPMVFFVLAAAWFVGVCVTDAAHRVVNGYHALMMGAMAWMYAVMSGGLLPARPHPDMNMSDTDMPGMDMSDMEASPVADSYPAWIDAIDWLCTTGFAIAAAWWLYRCFALRKAGGTRPSVDFLGAARQAMMASGMAVTFAVTL
jgi:hypothetical protein